MSATSIPKRRWLPRVRFSLRTLLLAVLLAGSAGGLWWRWAPWVIELTWAGVIGANEVWAGSFSPDGRMVILPGVGVRKVSGEAAPEIWNSEIGIGVFSHSGAVIFLGGRVRAQFVESGTGRILREWNLPRLNSWIRGACFSADDSRVVADDDAGRWMWDANTGEELAGIDGSRRATQPRDEKLIADFYGVHDYLLSCTASSHHGIRFLSDHRRVLAREDGAVAIVDALTGVVRRRFPLGNGREDCSCVSPNDAYVAGDFEDGTIHVWNAETGQELAVLKQPHAFTACMLFSPDSSRLFSTERGEEGIRIWDIISGQQLYTLADSELAVEFSPDKIHLLTASKDKAFLWSRRRPEYWWGVAWLPEFWLTALFSAAFAWSVWRDRRAA